MQCTIEWLTGFLGFPSFICFFFFGRRSVLWVGHFLASLSLLRRPVDRLILDLIRVIPDHLLNTPANNGIKVDMSCKTMKPLPFLVNFL